MIAGKRGWHQTLADEVEDPDECVSFWELKRRRENSGNFTPSGSAGGSCITKSNRGIAGGCFLSPSSTGTGKGPSEERSCSSCSAVSCALADSAQASFVPISAQASFVLSPAAASTAAPVMRLSSPDERHRKTGTSSMVMPLLVAGTNDAEEEGDDDPLMRTLSRSRAIECATGNHLRTAHNYTFRYEHRPSEIDAGSVDEARLVPYSASYPSPTCSPSAKKIGMLSGIQNQNWWNSNSIAESGNGNTDVNFSAIGSAPIASRNTTEDLQRSFSEDGATGMDQSDQQSPRVSFSSSCSGSNASGAESRQCRNVSLSSGGVGNNGHISPTGSLGASSDALLPCALQAGATHQVGHLRDQPLSSGALYYSYYTPPTSRPDGAEAGLSLSASSSSSTVNFAMPENATSALSPSDSVPGKDGSDPNTGAGTVKSQLICASAASPLERKTSLGACAGDSEPEVCCPTLASSKIKSQENGGPCSPTSRRRDPSWKKESEPAGGKGGARVETPHTAAEQQPPVAPPSSGAAASSWNKAVPRAASVRGSPFLHYPEPQDVEPEDDPAKNSRFTVAGTASLSFFVEHETAKIFSDGEKLLRQDYVALTRRGGQYALTAYRKDVKTVMLKLRRVFKRLVDENGSSAAVDAASPVEAYSLQTRKLYDELQQRLREAKMGSMNEDAEQAADASSISRTGSPSPTTRADRSNSSFVNHDHTETPPLSAEADVRRNRRRSPEGKATVGTGQIQLEVDVQNKDADQDTEGVQVTHYSGDAEVEVLLETDGTALVDGEAQVAKVDLVDGGEGQVADHVVDDRAPARRGSKRVSLLLDSDKAEETSEAEQPRRSSTLRRSATPKSLPAGGARSRSLTPEEARLKNEYGELANIRDELAGTRESIGQRRDELLRQSSEQQGAHPVQLNLEAEVKELDQSDQRLREEIARVDAKLTEAANMISLREATGQTVMNKLSSGSASRPGASRSLSSASSASSNARSSQQSRVTSTRSSQQNLASGSSAASAPTDAGPTAPGRGGSSTTATTRARGASTTADGPDSSSSSAGPSAATRATSGAKNASRTTTGRTTSGGAAGRSSKAAAPTRNKPMTPPTPTTADGAGSREANDQGQSASRVWQSNKGAPGAPPPRGSASKTVNLGSTAPPQQEGPAEAGVDQSLLFRKPIQSTVGLLRAVYELMENLYRVEREIKLPPEQVLSAAEERARVQNFRKQLGKLTEQCAGLSDELERQADALADGSRQQLFADVTKAYKTLSELHELLNAMELRSAERGRAARAVEELRSTLAAEKMAGRLPTSGVEDVEQAVKRLEAQSSNPPSSDSRGVDWPAVERDAQRLKRTLNELRSYDPSTLGPSQQSELRTHSHPDSANSPVGSGNKTENSNSSEGVAPPAGALIPAPYSASGSSGKDGAAKTATAAGAGDGLYPPSSGLTGAPPTSPKEARPASPHASPVEAGLLAQRDSDFQKMAETPSTGGQARKVSISKGTEQNDVLGAERSSLRSPSLVGADQRRDTGLKKKFSSAVATDQPTTATTEVQNSPIRNDADVDSEFPVRASASRFSPPPDPVATDAQRLMEEARKSVQELEQARRQTEKKNREFMERLETQRQSALADIEREEKERVEEIAARERTLARKLSFMREESEQRREEEKNARSEIQSMRAAARRDLEAKRSELERDIEEREDALRAQLERDRKDFDRRMRAKEKEAEDMLEAAREERERAEEARRGLEDAREKLLEKLEREREEGNRKVKDLEKKAEKELESARRKMDEAVGAREEVDAERIKMEQQLQAKLEQQQAEMREKFADREKLLKKELAASEERVRKDAEDAREKFDELRQLNEKLADARKKIEEEKLAREEMERQRKAQLDAEEKEMRKKLQEEREQMRREMEARRKEAEDELKRREKEVEDALIFAREKSAATRDDERKLEELRNSVKEQAETLQKQLEEQKRQTRAEMERREEENRKQAAEADERQKLLEQKESDRERAHKELMQQNDLLQKELDEQNERARQEIARQEERLKTQLELQKEELRLSTEDAVKRMEQVVSGRATTGVPTTDEAAPATTGTEAGEPRGSPEEVPGATAKPSLRGTAFRATNVQSPGIRELEENVPFIVQDVSPQAVSDLNTQLRRGAPPRGINIIPDGVDPSRDPSKQWHPNAGLSPRSQLALANDFPLPTTGAGGRYTAPLLQPSGRGISPHALDPGAPLLNNFAVIREPSNLRDRPSRPAPTQVFPDPFAVAAAPSRSKGDPSLSPSPRSPSIASTSRPLKFGVAGQTYVGTAQPRAPTATTSVPNNYPGHYDYQSVLHQTPQRGGDFVSHRAEQLRTSLLDGLEPPILEKLEKHPSSRRSKPRHRDSRASESATSEPKPAKSDLEKKYERLQAQVESLLRERERPSPRAQEQKREIEHERARLEADRRAFEQEVERARNSADPFPAGYYKPKGARNTTTTSKRATTNRDMLRSPGEVAPGTRGPSYYDKTPQRDHEYRDAPTHAIEVPKTKPSIAQIRPNPDRVSRVRGKDLGPATVARGGGLGGYGGPSEVYQPVLPGPRRSAATQVLDVPGARGSRGTAVESRLGQPNEAFFRMSQEAFQAPGETFVAVPADAANAGAERRQQEAPYRKSSRSGAESGSPAVQSREASRSRSREPDRRGGALLVMPVHENHAVAPAPHERVSRGEKRRTSPHTEFAFGRHHTPTVERHPHTPTYPTQKRGVNDEDGASKVKNGERTRSRSPMPVDVVEHEGRADERLNKLLESRPREVADMTLKDMQNLAALMQEWRQEAESLGFDGILGIDPEHMLGPAAGADGHARRAASPLSQDRTGRSKSGSRSRSPGGQSQRSRSPGGRTIRIEGDVLVSPKNSKTGAAGGDVTIPTKLNVVLNGSKISLTGSFEGKLGADDSNELSSSSTSDHAAVRRGRSPGGVDRDRRENSKERRRNDTPDIKRGARTQSPPPGTYVSPAAPERSSRTQPDLQLSALRGLRHATTADAAARFRNVPRKEQDQRFALPTRDEKGREAHGFVPGKQRSKNGDHAHGKARDPPTGSPSQAVHFSGEFRTAGGGALKGRERHPREDPEMARLLDERGRLIRQIQSRLRSTTGYLAGSSSSSASGDGTGSNSMEEWNIHNSADSSDVGNSASEADKFFRTTLRHKDMAASGTKLGRERGEVVQTRSEPVNVLPNTRGQEGSVAAPSSMHDGRDTGIGSLISHAPVLGNTAEASTLDQTLGKSGLTDTGRSTRASAGTGANRSLNFMKHTESSRPKRLSWQAAQPERFEPLPRGVRNPLSSEPRSQSPTYSVRNEYDMVNEKPRFTVATVESKNSVDSMGVTRLTETRIGRTAAIAAEQESKVATPFRSHVNARGRDSLANRAVSMERRNRADDFDRPRPFVFYETATGEASMCLPEEAEAEEAHAILKESSHKQRAKLHIRNSTGNAPESSEHSEQKSRADAGSSGARRSMANSHSCMQLPTGGTSGDTRGIHGKRQEPPVVSERISRLAALDPKIDPKKKQPFLRRDPTRATPEVPFTSTYTYHLESNLCAKYKPP